MIFRIVLSLSLVFQSQIIFAKPVAKASDVLEVKLTVKSALEVFALSCSDSSWKSLLKLMRDKQLLKDETSHSVRLTKTADGFAVEGRKLSVKKSGQGILVTNGAATFQAGDVCELVTGLGNGSDTSQKPARAALRLLLPAAHAQAPVAADPVRESRAWSYADTVISGLAMGTGAVISWGSAGFASPLGFLFMTAGYAVYANNTQRYASILAVEGLVNSRAQAVSCSESLSIFENGSARIAIRKTPSESVEIIDPKNQARNLSDGSLQEFAPNSRKRFIEIAKGCKSNEDKERYNLQIQGAAEQFKLRAAETQAPAPSPASSAPVGSAS